MRKVALGVVAALLLAAFPMSFTAASADAHAHVRFINQNQIGGPAIDIYIDGVLIVKDLPPGGSFGNWFETDAIGNGLHTLQVCTAGGGLPLTSGGNCANGLGATGPETSTLPGNNTGGVPLNLVGSTNYTVVLGTRVATNGPVPFLFVGVNDTTPTDFGFARITIHNTIYVPFPEVVTIVPGTACATGGPASYTLSGTAFGIPQNSPGVPFVTAPITAPSNGAAVAAALIAANPIVFAGTTNAGNNVILPIGVNVPTFTLTPVATCATGGTTDIYVVTPGGANAAPALDLCIDGDKVLTAVAPGTSQQVEVEAQQGAGFQLFTTTGTAACSGAAASVNLVAGTNLITTVLFNAFPACTSDCGQVLFVDQERHPNAGSASAFCAVIPALATVQSELKSTIGPINPGDLFTYPSAGAVKQLGDDITAAVTAGDFTVTSDIKPQWEVISSGLRVLVQTFKLVNYDLTKLPKSAVEELAEGANSFTLPGIPNDARTGAVKALTAWFTANCAGGAAPAAPSAVPASAGPKFTG